MTEASPFTIVGGHVSLAGRPVLHDIDLEMRSRDFLVLLGDNGSGKTTLVKALLGLVPLTRGRVEVFGVPISGFGDREHIGYVPQRASAGSGVPASVSEVVMSARAGRVGFLRPYSRRDREATRAALEAVNLTDLAERAVGSLSGGQQQRVLIARALAQEPRVLVLDEPVSSVDLAHQDAFAEILTRLKAAGTSVLLVAHGLGALGPLVDRAVVLEGGRIVHDGPPGIIPREAVDTLQSHPHHPQPYEGGAVS